MMCSSIIDLPNEILFQILIHIPPHLTPAVLLTCRTLNDVAEPRLWRYHCQTQFTYWSHKQGFHSQLAHETDSIDWRKTFAERYIIDKKTSYYLDGIIASQSGRIEKAENIVAFGYDAKDTLLRHMHVSDEAHDVLARRYYGNAVIRSLHCSMAVDEWANIEQDSSVNLERALTAFDMFVLSDRAEDFDYVSACLDSLASSISDEILDFNYLTARQKAKAITVYLRERGLTGIEKDAPDHTLQNTFIGLALRDKNHPSMSPISVAVYCSVAQRLGLQAYPCGFPFNVLVIVKPCEGFDMDGRAIQSSQEGEPMYLDPFRSDQELLVSGLQNQLAAMGVPTSDHKSLLDSSPAADHIHRTALNIISAVQKESEPRAYLASSVSYPIDCASAFYGALWALTILGGNKVPHNARRAKCLSYIIEHLRDQFFMDVGLAERYILPTFPSRVLSIPVADAIRKIRQIDMKPKAIKRRNNIGRAQVKYRIGQVFSHVRYGYQAVIIGWDIECGASEQWILDMNVNSLVRGRHQSFYHVLVEDSSKRYVAEDNVTLQYPDEPNPMLMGLAGRFFKRWDRLAKQFVSNIKDEYPDN